jgi:hypothetical protein
MDPIVLACIVLLVTGAALALNEHRIRRIEASKRDPIEHPEPVKPPAPIAKTEQAKGPVKPAEIPPRKNEPPHHPHQKVHPHK